ncbi:cyclase family protein [Domibacillus iocasae]|uniref:cyclase family protein n=1 Tax=Domibacillus iocasae TaxID=1714016 RepID=UPI002689B456
MKEAVCLIIQKIIDLSIPVTAQTPVYPGDPKPAVHPAAQIERDGYNVSSLQMGSHTGTHVDAPFHFNQHGKTIDQIPLSQVMGEGLVLDVTGKEAGEEITMEDVKHYEKQIRPGLIILFYTGWSRYIGNELYFQHPYISPAVIEWLLDKGISTFFIDAINIDPPDGSSFKCHELIMGADGVIGENFTHFEEITFLRPFIICLPLLMPGLDGSPVRAAALEWVSET